MDLMVSSHYIDVDVIFFFTSATADKYKSYTSDLALGQYQLAVCVNFIQSLSNILK